MRDPEFRKLQVDGAFLPHVAPVNRLVDRLRNLDGRGWMPYVAPIYGGVGARVLFLLESPGPKTNDNEAFDGSGFLCLENDDPTAERLATLMDQVGLEAAECIAWNAYPWFINRSPKAAELEAGVAPLLQLLALLPPLEFVVLIGGSAKDSWHRLEKRDPRLAARYRTFPIRHLGRRAFAGGDKEAVARWKREQVDVFERVARLIHGDLSVTTEAEVVMVFALWLRSQGWIVDTEVDYVDVVATRGEERLIAEAKGKTSCPGLDVDTMYGQLLRRMAHEEPNLQTRYAIVVPESMLGTVRRVPLSIRELLRIDIYGVDRSGKVSIGRGEA